MKPHQHPVSWIGMPESHSRSVWNRAVFKNAELLKQTLPLWSGVVFLGSAAIVQGVSTNFHAAVLADAPILY